MAIAKTVRSSFSGLETGQLILTSLRGLKNGSITIIKQDDQIIQVNICEKVPSEHRCPPLAI